MMCLGLCFFYNTFRVIFFNNMFSVVFFFCPRLLFTHSCDPYRCYHTLFPRSSLLCFSGYTVLYRLNSIKKFTMQKKNKANKETKKERKKWTLMSRAFFSEKTENLLDTYFLICTYRNIISGTKFVNFYQFSKVK